MTFPKMKRSNRAISPEKTMMILQSADYGVLSTIGQNGYPYGIPVNYVTDGQKIYFHCALTGSKIDNMVHNPKVCFTVVGNTEILADQFSTRYESVVVFGTASATTREDKPSVFEKLIKKYSPAYKEQGYAYTQPRIDVTAVYEIQIDHMTGKANK